METSESLSIESFSYSWLVDLKPSFDSPKGSFRASCDSFDDFIEMDPKLSDSKRFLVFRQDFDFDLPTFQPSVHADELISNGIVVPLFLKSLDVGIYDSGFNSNLVSPISSSTLQSPCSYQRSHSLSFRRYKRLPKRVQKYLNLVRLIWLRMRRGRCDTNELKGAKNWEFSGTIDSCGSDSWPRSWVLESSKSCMSSPRISEACGADNWRRSYDSESSISEAVLHCKKTIGQHMSPVEYRTVLKYRLMISLFPGNESCPVCRKACLDSFGEHAVHCREFPGFKYRHDMVRDVLFDVLKRAGVSAKKEAPVNFLTDPREGRSTLRPADVLVFGWAGGKHACVDLTGVFPLVGLRSGGFTAGEAAFKAAPCKVTKHEKACIDNQREFIPFAFDTFGFLAPDAVVFLNRVQRVMHSNVMSPRSMNVVFQRISFAIQKELATQLVARLPSIALC